MSEERTAKDFVKDMLSHGRDWLDIIAVARVVRGGKWYEEAKTILQQSGQMPTDEGMIVRLRKADILKKNKEERSRYVTGKVLRSSAKKIRSVSSGRKD